MWITFIYVLMTILQPGRYLHGFGDPQVDRYGHTAHTQPHKSLLVGWIVCRMATAANNDGMTTDDWEMTRTRGTE
jgi:hypothetical protein